MGSVASLPEAIGDFFSSVAELVGLIVDALIKVIHFLPRLVQGIINIFEDFVLILGLVSRSMRYTIFIAPAVGIYLMLDKIIRDLGLN
jgi:hypothetical protein